MPRISSAPGPATNRTVKFCKFFEVAAIVQPAYAVAVYPAISAAWTADVHFYHSHLFHRSYPTRTTNRFRRSYVLYDCNARSWVPWYRGGYEGDSGNYRQILARGKTHLPYAEPVFGTSVLSCR